MRTIAIIQARMDSTRLPGKALAKIGDRTILEWVIHRTQQVPGLSQIIIATSARGSDQPIADISAHNDIPCYRSSAHDVLNRYHQTTIAYQADRILRITADCPLHDPHIQHSILQQLDHAEYATANHWPIGLAQEAFTRQALQRAWENATHPYDREHVVTWMITDPNTTKSILEAPQPHAGGRYTIDTSTDLAHLIVMHSRHPDLFDMTANQLINANQQQPAAA